MRLPIPHTHALPQELADAQAEAEAARAQAAAADKKRAADYTVRERKAALLTNEVQKLRRKGLTALSQLAITHGVRDALQYAVHSAIDTVLSAFCLALCQRRVFIIDLWVWVDFLFGTHERDHAVWAHEIAHPIESPCQIYWIT